MRGIIMKGLFKKTVFLACILFILLSISAINAEDVNDTCTYETDINLGATSLDNSFADLQREINGHDGTVELTSSYKYAGDNDQDYSDGVKILKDIHIIGKNNAYIDGSNSARLLFITEDCNVVLENLTLKNGYIEEDGAGVYLCADSNLKLINCIFENNKVYNHDGAAVSADDRTNVEMNHCEFHKNACIRETDLPWSQFKCGMGSAICLDIGSTLKIYDSIFKENTAHMATILVVSRDNKNYNASTLYVKGCTFESNTVFDCGIIYMDELGHCQILDSVFKSNKITNNGGVLELDTTLTGLVQNCQFEENTASVGGGIHVKVIDDSHRAYLNVKDCTFTNNKATVSGGAIYSSGGVLQVSNCRFEHNSAPEKGGAVYSNKGIMKIFDSTFSQNTASDKGGGVCAFTSELTVERSTFNQNTASDKGGGIYSNSGLIDVKASQFNQNSANRGGGLFIDTPKVSVLSSSFANNKAVDRGGAIYSIIENIASSGCSYVGNTAPLAPSVYGAFHAVVKQYITSPKSVVLKLTLSSPWQVSPSQQIKVTITGPKSFTSKWLNTNSKGELTIEVPAYINIGKSKMDISIKPGVCYVKSWQKVKDSAKIKAPKSVKKSSDLKITVLGKTTNKPIKNTKFKVKVANKKFNVKTNSKGVLKVSTKSLSKGTKKGSVILKNGDYNINSKFSVKIK